MILFFLKFIPDLYYCLFTYFEDIFYLLFIYFKTLLHFFGWIRYYSAHIPAHWICPQQMLLCWSDFTVSFLFHFSSSVLIFLLRFFSFYSHILLSLIGTFFIYLSFLNRRNISSLKFWSERLHSWLMLVEYSELTPSVTRCGGILHCFLILTVTFVMSCYFLCAVMLWLEKNIWPESEV